MPARITSARKRRLTAIAPNVAANARNLATAVFVAPRSWMRKADLRRKGISAPVAVAQAIRRGDPTRSPLGAMKGRPILFATARATCRPGTCGDVASSPQPSLWQAPPRLHAPVRAAILSPFDSLHHSLLRYAGSMLEASLISR